MQKYILWLLPVAFLRTAMADVPTSSVPSGGPIDSLRTSLQVTNTVVASVFTSYYTTPVTRTMVYTLTGEDGSHHTLTSIITGETTSTTGASDTAMTSLTPILSTEIFTTTSAVCENATAPSCWATITKTDIITMTTTLETSTSLSTTHICPPGVHNPSGDQISSMDSCPSSIITNTFTITSTIPVQTATTTVHETSVITTERSSDPTTTSTPVTDSPTSSPTSSTKITTEIATGPSSQAPTESLSTLTTSTTRVTSSTASPVPTSECGKMYSMLPMPEDGLPITLNDTMSLTIGNMIYTIPVGKSSTLSVRNPTFCSRDIQPLQTPGAGKKSKRGTFF